MEAQQTCGGSESQVCGGIRTPHHIITYSKLFTEHYLIVIHKKIYNSKITLEGCPLRVL